VAVFLCIRHMAAASKLLGVEQRLLKDVAALQPGLLVHQTDVLRWACNELMNKLCMVCFTFKTCVSQGSVCVTMRKPGAPLHLEFAGMQCVCMFGCDACTSVIEAGCIRTWRHCSRGCWCTRQMC
jgi:hypothetical protein